MNRVCFSLVVYWLNRIILECLLCEFFQNDLLDPLNLVTKDLFPPATKLEQGYIFTGICDSVNRGGAWSQGGAWSGGVPGGEPPLKTATAVGGMHPTGMHSCLQ